MKVAANRSKCSLHENKHQESSLESAKLFENDFVGAENLYGGGGGGAISELEITRYQTFSVSLSDQNTKCSDLLSERFNFNVGIHVQLGIFSA